MTVNIIVGYLRLMQRVFQHYKINMRDIGVPEILIRQFYDYLENDENHEFTTDQYSQILICLQKRFDRPISLVVAEQVALQDVGLVGYLVSTSFDLQQAFVTLQKYYPLLYKQTNSEILQVVEQQNAIKMYWIGQLQEWRYFCELDIALLYKVTDLVVRHQLIAPDYVMLGYTPELPLYYYQEFFNCPIRLEHKRYGIQFPKQVLKTRSHAPDWQLNQVLSTQAQQSLQDQKSFEQQQLQLKQKIIRLIEQGLQQEDALQMYVADQLHYSERTLQRQLKLYNLNFQAILDEYRMQASIEYLQQHKSLTEIAERLNYADQSAFGRAFKRWTGQTPKQYLKSRMAE